MEDLVGTFCRWVARTVLLLLICTACAVEKAPVFERDGVKYGVTDGLFRSRWWNYTFETDWSPLASGFASKELFSIR